MCPFAKDDFGWRVDVAQSPAHKLGQIIGDRIEAAIGEPLRNIADEFGLYLDCQHDATLSTEQG